MQKQTENDAHLLKAGLINLNSISKMSSNCTVLPMEVHCGPSRESSLIVFDVVVRWKPADLSALKKGDYILASSERFEGKNSRWLYS